jgi:predicted unusual protein kinase regulating ubiquinone biosynthesis (AarF/ABC1/UbiB family)
MTDAERIRALRTALRLSQRELADDWGVSPGAIARWETGSNPIPGPVRKLLEIYEGELSDSGPVRERDSSFLARGFNGIVAYGVWVFFRRTFGVAGAASATAHDAMARQFANHLAKHRGVLMKLAQRALYLEPLLSAEERDALAKLRDHAQPLSVATVNRLFRTTFNADPRAMFADWDPRPARQGSIGQVYRATLADGRRVAVKVQ